MVFTASNRSHLVINLVFCSSIASVGKRHYLSLASIFLHCVFSYPRKWLVSYLG